MFTRKLKTEVEKYLTTREIVVIHGARQVGKTTLLELLGRDLPPADQQYLDLEDSRLLDLCQQGPAAVKEYLGQLGRYKGQKKFFLMIDEIQYLSNPSSFLKLFHDHYPEFKLIVSGSSSFDIKKKFKDSLTGRTADFILHPLDFEEFLTFKGSSYTLKPGPRPGPVGRELENLYRQYALYGGYPKIVLTDSIEAKEKYLQQIIDTYVKKDIRDLGNIRDPAKFNGLLAALAGQSGSLLNVTELANTARLSRQTVEQYLFILENTFVIRLLRPYSRNLRSELFKTPKIFFMDPGIMQMLSARRLPAELLGPALETAVFSDLAKHDGREYFFWRTQDKKEIDFVIKNGQHLLPAEVKLNAAGFKSGAMEYFMDHYRQKTGLCVSLTGTKASKDNRISFIKPWELIAALQSG